MSILKIYYPEETHIQPVASKEEPSSMILPFDRGSIKKPHYLQQDDWTLRRARVMFKNQHCPACRCATVASLELRDGQLNRKNHTIPGTASVVGFRCESCDNEWPA